MKLNAVVIVCFLLQKNILYSYNKSSCDIPYIVISSKKNNQRKYVIPSTHLDENVLFNIFDQSYIKQRLIPMGSINETQITGRLLIGKIKKLLYEVKQGKKTFTDFILLKKTNFNFKKKCGLIILKFKDYPFVVKVFIETAESFSQPFSKGLEQFLFYLMGGGINRHLMGFTRIKNLEWVRYKLNTSRFWKNKVVLPNKWFWVPPDNEVIEVTGNSFGNQKQQRMQIPGTYVIIADFIKTDREFSIFNSRDRRMALKLCNFLQMRIDPNINNFLRDAQGRIVLVDTEHFPTLFGLKDIYMFSHFSSYYFVLIKKFTKDIYKYMFQKESSHKKTISI